MNIQDTDDTDDATNWVPCAPPLLICACVSDVAVSMDMGLVVVSGPDVAYVSVYTLPKPGPQDGTTGFCFQRSISTDTCLEGIGMGVGVGMGVTKVCCSSIAFTQTQDGSRDLCQHLLLADTNHAVVHVLDIVTASWVGLVAQGIYVSQVATCSTHVALLGTVHGCIPTVYVYKGHGAHWVPLFHIGQPETILRFVASSVTTCCILDSDCTEEDSDEYVQLVTLSYDSVHMHSVLCTPDGNAVAIMDKMDAHAHCMQPWAPHQYLVWTRNEGAPSSLKMVHTSGHARDVLATSNHVVGFAVVPAIGVVTLSHQEYRNEFESYENTGSVLDLYVPPRVRDTWTMSLPRCAWLCAWYRGVLVTSSAGI